MEHTQVSVGDDGESDGAARVERLERHTVGLFADLGVAVGEHRFNFGRSYTTARLQSSQSSLA